MRSVRESDSSRTVLKIEFRNPSSCYCSGRFIDHLVSIRQPEMTGYVFGGSATVMRGKSPTWRKP